MSLIALKIAIGLWVIALMIVTGIFIFNTTSIPEEGNFTEYDYETMTKIPKDTKDTE